MENLLTRGFRSERALRNHFALHGSEYMVNTAEEYLELADKFLGSPLQGYMKECHCSTCDDILRYDKRSQSFGVLREGYIATFYTLTKGSRQRNEEYFDNECNDMNCQGVMR